METVIYEDTPLADYLQEDQGDNGWPSATKPASTTSSDLERYSYAPRGEPQAKTERRRRPVSQIIFTESLISRLRQQCMDTFAWRIGQSEKIKALEQLRFTIIGSQLLSDRSSSGAYTRKPDTSNPPDEVPIEYTISGLLYTAGAAFACALSLWWATKTSDSRKKRTRLGLVATLVATAALSIYIFCLRQYRRYARGYAVRVATAMVINAQAFDSAAYAASSFIQEVELVSRGYKLSNPLPPASRLEDGKAQNRRCRRLRQTLRASLDHLILPHVNAYQLLHTFANAANLERYFDMYEISHSDLDEINKTVDDKHDEDPESLRNLKIDLNRLFISRKIFLCSILALDADRKALQVDWSQVTELMEDISNRTAIAATQLDEILGEEQSFAAPPSPRSPVTPGREKLQQHVRRFANLSQGLRGLQVKMHLLREESDRSLGSSDEVTQLGSYLLEQYDAIGTDMKSLLQDWEDGRTALTTTIGKNERRVSSAFIATPCKSRASSPGSSLGGITAVGGSPSEALKILNGEMMSTNNETAKSEEEVFEAFALPRGPTVKPSNVSREERIAKIREDRLRVALEKQSRDAGRSMVKELETVIAARPHRRKSSSPMPPLPVRIAASPPMPASPTFPNLAVKPAMMSRNELTSSVP